MKKERQYGSGNKYPTNLNATSRGLCGACQKHTHYCTCKEGEGTW